MAERRMLKPSAIDDALEFVLEHEGGFVNHQHDRGGATKYGITTSTLTKWRGRFMTVADVQSLTQDEARTIYAELFWKPVRGDELPYSLALVLFDTGVNSGPAMAIRLLQQEVGVIVDGVFGPKTMAAVQDRYTKTLIQELCWARMEFLAELVRNDHSQASFILGWTRRVRRLAREVRG